MPLCPGALEPVVEVRGLEGEQVDPRGDVEHPIERAPPHELAEHAALLVLDRLREVERDGDGDERREHRGELSERGARARTEHGVEHRLADEQLHDDPDRRQELEHGRDEEHVATRAPHES